jgi:hypothetical protein
MAGRTSVFDLLVLPLTKWYCLIYRMATYKVGVSIWHMQRLLEIKQYRTTWLMAHKIRKAMADRDSRYSLAGLIEMDDSFFGPSGGKRSRGSDRKKTVIRGAHRRVSEKHLYWPSSEIGHVSEIELSYYYERQIDRKRYWNFKNIRLYKIVLRIG